MSLQSNLRMESYQMNATQIELPLSGRWLLIVRLAWWVLTISVLIIFALAIPWRYRELLATAPATQILTPWQSQFVVSVDAHYIPLQLTAGAAQTLELMGLSLPFYAAYVTGFEIAFVATSALLGMLIFWRKSDNRFGIFCALVFVLGGLFYSPTLKTLIRLDPAWRAPVSTLLACSTGGALIFCFIFPNGRFVPAWLRLVTIGWIGWVIASIFFFPINPFNWPPTVLLSVALVLFGLASVIQFYRYVNISTAIERQQTKWMVFSIALLTVGFVVLNFNIPGLLFPTLRQPGRALVIYNLVAVPLYTFICLLPVLAITIAILRYRLWDIDLIIRRTLIYAVLSSILALFYFSSVLLLERSVYTVTGQKRSEFVTIIITLTIVLLFDPLRRQIQSVIDHRFYRRKYNAEQTLAAFGATVRDEIALDQLMYELMSIVEETLQPAHVSVWLQPTTNEAKAMENIPEEIRYSYGR